MKHALRTAATALLLPSSALAQDGLAFSLGVDWIYKQLTLEEKFGGVGVTNEYKPKFWMFGISPSVAWRGFFVSLGIERSVGNSSTASYSNNGTFYQMRTWERQENSASIGYNVWRGLSVFGGYLKNKTTSDLQAGARFDYTEEGPYYGLGYAHRFGTGTLSGSLAYTDAKGRVHADPGGFLDQGGDIKGQSFGLVWSAPISGSWHYRIGYKGTRYEFEFFDPNFAENRTTKQAYDAFFLGVANYF
jgi:hypothetical protein